VLIRFFRAQEPLNDRHVVPESAWRFALVSKTRSTLSIDQSANGPQSPVRPGGEFFAAPTGATQRRYEALRAYLHDGEPAAAVAERFGYTPASLNSAVRDFRAGAQEFFLTATPGPKRAPAKDAARSRIVELRTDGHSIDEIAVRQADVVRHDRLAEAGGVRTGLARAGLARARLPVQPGQRQRQGRSASSRG
jgi:transposase-like protein